MPDVRISEEWKGKRIDIALAKLLATSRAQIQKLLKMGQISFDQKQCKPNMRLKGGEIISILNVQEKPTQEKTYDLTIIYEDKDVIVLNKPAGLLVHPTREHSAEFTLIDLLRKHFPAIDSVGDNPLRPGIVHRLDKDVSGVMVIAKTQAAFNSLKTQFVNRTIRKEYLGLVYGQLSKNHDQINFKVVRSKTKGRMIARPESQEGKEALTEYTVLQRFKNHTYAQIVLHTGRTHQIRVHFRAIDHPLVGDHLYQKSKMKTRAIELGRIFLHAYTLQFQLPNGQTRSFRTPLPDQLQHILNTL